MKLEEWDENIGITWQKKSRIKLNKVIRKYNIWVENHTDDYEKTVKLIEKINRHLKMHYSNQDGGSGYKEELLRIKRRVKKYFLYEQHNR